MLDLDGAARTRLSRGARWRGGGEASACARGEPDHAQATAREDRAGLPADVQLGAPAGFVFVREDRVGDFLIQYTYAEKRAHHVLHWVCYFYRPDSGWFVDSVSWDDDVQALF